MVFLHISRTVAKGSSQNTIIANTSYILICCKYNSQNLVLAQSMHTMKVKGGTSIRWVSLHNYQLLQLKLSLSYDMPEK